MNSETFTRLWRDYFTGSSIINRKSEGIEEILMVDGWWLMEDEETLWIWEGKPLDFAREIWGLKPLDFAREIWGLMIVGLMNFGFESSTCPVNSETFTRLWRDYFTGSSIINRKSERIDNSYKGRSGISKQLKMDWNDSIKSINLEKTKDENDNNWKSSKWI